MFESSLVLIFPAAMAFAGAMDLLTMTIPNRISLTLVGAFAIVALLTGLPTHMVLLHAAAGTAMLAAGVLIFAMGWAGGGDAKLLAAGALWVGLDTVPAFLLLMGVFGGLLTMLALLFRAYPAAALPLPDWVLRLHRAATGIPYGLAIAASALVVFPQTDIFRALITP